MMLVKNNRRHNRKIGILLGCKYRRLEFVSVTHSLYKNKVGTGFGSVSDNIGIYRYALFKIKRSHRFEELACRTHIKCYICLASAVCDCFLRIYDRSRNYFFKIIVFKSVGAECIS